MYPGRCIKCGAFDGLGEHDALCESCYEQVRWEEITAINCNPQVDEIDQDDQDGIQCPHCERVQEHSANVYDSGAPDYIMGFNCEFCGRFVEQDV